MFDGDFRQGSVKWTLSTQPFVGHDAERVLIAGRYRMRPQLLRRHVRNGSGCIWGLPGTRAPIHHSDAKVAQQDFAAATQEHVLWFDIAVNQLPVVRVLQGIGYLAHIRKHRLEWEARSVRMALAQVAVGRKVHHQERGCTIYTKVHYLHNMRMA